jgi:hypothetical protein
MRTDRVRSGALAAVTLALSAPGCASGPVLTGHVPVIAATPLINLHTAEHCEYLGVASLVTPDAVVVMKNIGAESQATLIVLLNEELKDEAEYDSERRAWITEAGYAAAKLVRCPAPVQAATLRAAKVMDTR